MALKNVKKIIYLVLVSIIGGQMNASEKDDDISYIRYAKEIMNPFIKKSEKNYDLDCIGTGGRYAKNVGGISLSFIAYRKSTIEEARTLEVIMIETLLEQVNAHEKIKPFLAEYPFKSKDINISIAFRKKDNSCYTDGSVVYASNIKNKLYYAAEDPKTEERTTIYEEPYEEAVKIVNKSK